MSRPRSFEVETPEGASHAERELDRETMLLRGQALECLYVLTIVENADERDERDQWLEDARALLASIVAKVENISRCAGDAIHGGPLNRGKVSA